MERPSRLLRERRRGGQSFVVCARIEDLPVNYKGLVIEEGERLIRESGLPVIFVGVMTINSPARMLRLPALSCSRPSAASCR